MRHHTARVAALALLLAALACSESPPGTPPDDGAAIVRSPEAATATQPELLARSLALALGADPAFRAHVKAELDRSPYREHKLPFQRFLAAERGPTLSAMSRQAQS